MVTVGDRWLGACWSVGRWCWSPRVGRGHDGRFVVEQVGDGDGLVAVGAWSADADAAGEGAALLAALFAEEPFTAVGAFVDGDLLAGLGGGDEDGGGRVVVASAERGLAAGCAAVPLPSGRGEGVVAVGAGHRRGVVPRRVGGRLVLLEVCLRKCTRAGV